MVHTNNENQLKNIVFMELSQLLNAHLLSSKRIGGFFHWVEQLHCTDTVSRKLILHFWLLATLLLAPLLHSCSLDWMLVSPPGAAKTTPQTRTGDTSGRCLPHPRYLLPPRTPPDSRVHGSSRPRNSPLVPAPREGAQRSLTQRLRDGPRGHSHTESGQRRSQTRPELTRHRQPPTPRGRSTALRRLSPLRGAGGSRAGIGSRSGPAKARMAPLLPTPLMAPSASACSLPLPVGPRGACWVL